MYKFGVSGLHNLGCSTSRFMVLSKSSIFCVVLVKTFPSEDKILTLHSFPSEAFTKVVFTVTEACESSILGVVTNTPFGAMCELLTSIKRTAA